MRWNMTRYIIDIPDGAIDKELGVYFPDERHEPMPVEPIEVWNTRAERTCEGTRWHELFGTPERAARTMAGITCDDGGCEGCTLYGANCSYDADALLEWLRSES